jgi:uncharacterized protein Usg
LKIHYNNETKISVFETALTKLHRPGIMYIDYDNSDQFPALSLILACWNKDMEIGDHPCSYHNIFQDKKITEITHKNLENVKTALEVQWDQMQTEFLADKDTTTYIWEKPVSKQYFRELIPNMEEKIDEIKSILYGELFIVTARYGKTITDFLSKEWTDMFLRQTEIIIWFMEN